MKKLILLSALVLSVFLVACPPAQDGPVSQVVTLKEADSPFIAFSIWVKAGSQNDPAGKEGLAAFTANILANSGTAEDSYEQILEKLYPMAAGYGYNVDKEMTVFRGKIHKDNLKEYYGLFKNALLKPSFNEEDFNRIKTQVVNFTEQSRRYDKDEELSKELLYYVAYEGTPYAHPEEGYVSSVKSFTIEDVKKFYADYYVSNNIVVGIGGGYPEGFDAEVRADFDTLPEKEVLEVAKPEPKAVEGINVLLVERETGASAISFGYPYGLLRSDKDFSNMMIANSWLGEHRNSFSNLYQVIREARGMNYGDYSYIEAFPLGYTTQSPPVNVSRRSQMFEIWIRPIAQTKAGNLHDRTLFATRAALRELKKLVDNGMTEETYSKTRDFLYNYTVKYGSTITRRLAYAVDDAFYGIADGGFLKNIRPNLKSSNLEAVNAAIKKHLQCENLWIVIITQDAEKMKETLLAGTPTNIDYAGEKPQTQLDEDKEIAAFPIPLKEENIRIVDISKVFE